MVRCKMKQPSENNHMLLMIWKVNLRNPNLLANLEVQEFASQVVVLTKDLASFKFLGVFFQLRPITCRDLR